MSKVRVNEIRNYADTVTLAKLEDGQLTGALSPQTGFRNRIINGDMRIAQRGTAAVTASGSFPVDRFLVNNTTDGAFSAQQDSSAPSGFTNSLKYTTTTADSSLTGAKALPIIQNIEGLNCSDLAWGTVNAQPVTLSFWVRSSLTGTFGGSLRNSGNNRSYPFTYNISSADTWEYKSVTVPGDTTGTWLITNDLGLRLSFSMGAGPDRSGTAGAWNSDNNISATGATSVVGTNGATWYVTGVQLEKGTVATPFEFRSIGQELALCQRYFLRAGAGGFGWAQNTTNVGLQVSFPVEMRATPTVTGISGTGSGLILRIGGSTENVNTFTSLGANSNRGCFLYGAGSGYTTGSGYHVMNNFAFSSAEL